MERKDGRNEKNGMGGYDDGFEEVDLDNGGGGGGGGYGGEDQRRDSERSKARDMLEGRV